MRYQDNDSDRWWWLVKRDGLDEMWRVARHDSKAFKQANWRQRFSTRKGRTDTACKLMNEDRIRYLEHLRATKPPRREWMIGEKMSRRKR